MQGNLSLTLFFSYINDPPDLLSFKVLESMLMTLYAVYEVYVMKDAVQREKTCWRRKTPTSRCKLGTSCLESAEFTKYLVITIQSDLRFDQHMNDGV